MRKGEITEAMIRQSKEIWELLKPDEFVPEPGDWISALHIHTWLMYEPHYIDERGNLRDKWHSMIQFGNDDWHPIFTFSHCLDLLGKRGWYQETGEHTSDHGFRYMGERYYYHIRVEHVDDDIIFACEPNHHECAQAVLLKVLKEES